MIKYTGYGFLLYCIRFPARENRLIISFVKRGPMSYIGYKPAETAVGRKTHRPYRFLPPGLLNIVAATVVFGQPVLCFAVLAVARS